MVVVLLQVQFGGLILPSTTAVGRSLLNRAGDFARTYRNKQFGDVFIKNTKLFMVIQIDFCKI